MAFSIKHREADRLVREVARMTGESLTDAVVNSLRERLERLENRPQRRLSEQLSMIADRIALLPVFDARTPDEIIGYDEFGLP
jgi:antitoxin VapB